MNEVKEALRKIAGLTDDELRKAKLYITIRNGQMKVVRDE